jgi:hypothetical protein
LAVELIPRRRVNNGDRGDEHAHRAASGR